MSKLEEKSRAFPGGVGQWQKMVNSGEVMIKSTRNLEG